MARITFSGVASAWQQFGGSREAEEITDPGRLPYFAGIAYRRVLMCDYLADGEDSAPRRHRPHRRLH